MTPDTPPINLQQPRPSHPASPRSRFTLPKLRLLSSERRLLLILVDALILCSALLWALSQRAGLDVSLSALFATAKWYLTLLLIWLACAFFFDLYDLARAASATSILPVTGAAVLATVAIYLLIPWFAPPLISRSLIFLFTAAAWVGVVAWRAFYALFFVQPWFKQRALMVGAGWAGRTLVAAMRTHPHDANPYRGTGYDLIGFVDDDPGLHSQEFMGVSVLGGSDRLLNLAEEYDVDEIIVAITHRHTISTELFDTLLRCREAGLCLSTMSELYERLLGRVPVDHLGRDLHMILRDRVAAGDRVYLLFKHSADFVLALAALPCLGLVSLLLLPINRICAPGPLFYRQPRVGQGGRIFQIIKFRTMAPDAEQASGAVWAEQEDPRVTPVGRWLRRLRLDELPQCLNVLRGEMSLIGPRPERPEFVAQLAQELPFYRARHAIRPGISGWAQVRYRYAASAEDARVKLEYDLYYVRHLGFWLDLHIAFRTFLIMLQMKGH